MVFPAAVHSVVDRSPPDPAGASSEGRLTATDLTEKAAGKSVPLTLDQIAAVAGLWSRDRRQVVASFGGQSMRPTLTPESEVVLHCGEPVRCGDVVAYLGRSGVVVHRIVAFGSKAAWLLTRGDASWLPDPPVPMGAVFARVAGLRTSEGIEPLAAPPASVPGSIVLGGCHAVMRLSRAAGIAVIVSLWRARRLLLLLRRLAGPSLARKAHT